MKLDDPITYRGRPGTVTGVASQGPPVVVTLQLDDGNIVKIAGAELAELKKG